MMTESENIDRIDNAENVTVTSDGAFERITSDIKMEETTNDWYLKQNTAWLVQEIPNISFLDIADTMLESKKTLHNRENRTIVVWSKGKSIEAQPQDIATLSLSTDETTLQFPWVVHFDWWTSSLHWTVCRIDENDSYKIKILKDWYYRISYWWTIDPWNATSFSIWVWTSNQYVTADKFTWWSYWTEMSWWRSVSNVYLEKWDYVFMDVLADSSIMIKKDYTYLEIQFQQYVL